MYGTMLQTFSLKNPFCYTSSVQNLALPKLDFIRRKGIK